MNGQFCFFKWSRWVLLLLVLLLLGMLDVSRAEAAVEMSFSGKLVSGPACTINTQPVTIDFGRVDVDKLEAGISKLKLVDYTPVCKDYNNESLYAVKLMFGGARATWNYELPTSNSSVAVGMYDGNNRQFKVNTPVTITDLRNWPKLYVKLVKNGAVLKEGTFTAAGTITMTIE
ncbi:fimbrial protein [Pseudomonas shahriarae]|uniref:fimbrial protein n=1 Tax=Pseudomonas shahriarae TaxID=2745512 RepID=UPI002360F3DA|nr:fimbrial protein [Pseudomonas shahriarae]MDD1135708.1 fimbrial protein [Pseudomonas shahriarae]